MLNQAYETMKIDLQMFAEPVDDGSDLFLDDAEQTSEADEDIEESEEQPEEEPADDPAEGQNAPEAEDKPNETPAEAATADKIRLKYNGEEMEVTVEEAAALAQKGKNYDKVAAERDALRATDAGSVVKAAAEAGMSVPNFLKFINEQRAAALMTSTIDAVMQEHPTLDASAAEEIVKLRLAEKRRAEQETEQEAAKQAEAEKNKVWLDFVQRYPQYRDVTQFPPAVLTEIQAGATPIEAMQRFEAAEQQKEIARLKTELEAANKNKENKQKSAGSAASTGSQDPPDAFILGFLGD